ncbi:MAG: hypothetical protein Q4Q03_05490 [Bowdeniella nasicola]|nr:hypothetical protein [Bowdeniella nasicola]
MQTFRRVVAALSIGALAGLAMFAPATAGENERQCVDCWTVTF